MTEELIAWPLQVGEVAARYGVTVRALHHYEDVGLVVPSERSLVGYRLYSSGDVDRLAHVVLLRRMEMPLEEIRRALEANTVSEQLRQQRESVIARIGELNEIVRSIDVALEAEMTENHVTPEQMKRIFGDSFNESYAVEAESRWGETAEWKESSRRQQNYSVADWEQIKAESDAVMSSFATAMRDGIQPEEPRAQDAVAAHVAHLEKWFYPVRLQLLAGLGRMYVADHRFAQTYNDVAPGLAQYVSDAIAAYVASHAEPGADARE